MGKLWRADKALENSEGLKWVRERLADLAWAKVDWITVRRGHSEAYAFRGVCKYPRKEHSGYRINCNVSKHARYPITYYMRVSPLEVLSNVVDRALITRRPSPRSFRPILRS